MSDDDRLLAEAVGAVYAVSPEHFMATRSALVTQAKASGNAAVAKDISRLRRPSVAAWAINNLVRTRPDVVANLIGVGVRMRSAQAALDGPALSALRAPRNAAMSDFTTAAMVQAAAQGRFLVATVQDQIEATAVASLADEVAADAVASGALIKALSYSGFGEVDFSDAVVRTATGRLLSVLHGGGTTSGDPTAADSADPPTPQDRESAQARARVALAEAEIELSAAIAVLREAEAEREQAATRQAEAAHLFAQARQRLERTQTAQAAAEAQHTAAALRHRAAERARHSAAKRVGEAPT
ncbi:MAG: hypothetical protein KBB39_11815 [Phycicoccus sp.]|nr:hypothetical protein [Phycicoccus sp.]